MEEIGRDVLVCGAGVEFCGYFCHLVAVREASSSCATLRF